MIPNIQSAIPDDWHIQNLGTLCSQIVGGGTPSRNEKNYWDGDIPWATVKDISDFNAYDTIEHISKDAVNKSATHVIPSGTIIIATRISVGNPVIYSIDTAINQDLKALFIKEEFNKGYLVYFLRAITPKLDEIASGTTVKGLSLDVLTKQQVLLPTKAVEQQAIANALSDIDALIEAKEALLEKKRAIKLGAMQELLTGKKRLPGFPVTPMKHTEVGEIPEDWEVKELGSLASMKSGQGITSASIEEYGEYPCYGGNGLRGYTRTYTHEGIFPLIGRQGALCGNVTLARDRFYASEHAVVVTTYQGVDAEWMSKILIFMNLNSISEASAQGGLAVSKILKLKAPVPQRAEQCAIAAVLFDLDTEIEALEEELKKLVDLKQGMMQQLLTGKIRLIKTKKDNKKANSTFKAAVLVSEIFSRYESDKHLGSIKMAKLYYMAATMADVWEELNFHPLQQAAGPYDPKWRRSMTKLLERQKCIREVKVSYGNGKTATHYERMSNYDNFRSKYTWDRYFTKEQRDAMVHVFDIFLNASTDQAEIAATVMGAWVKCIEDGDMSDDKVIERAQNWSERKKRFKPEKWTLALAWMKKKNLIPPYTQGK